MKLRPPLLLAGTRSTSRAATGPTPRGPAEPAAAEPGPDAALAALVAAEPLGVCAGETASLAQMTLAGGGRASPRSGARPRAPLREHWDAVLGDGVCRHGAKGLLIVWVAEAPRVLPARRHVRQRAAVARRERGRGRAAARRRARPRPRRSRTRCCSTSPTSSRVEDVSVVGARAADDRGRNAAASARAPALPL